MNDSSVGFWAPAMNVAQPHLQVRQIVSGDALMETTSSVIAAEFDLGRQTFLATYSRRPVHSAHAAPRQPFEPRLLADVIDPGTVISDFSHIAPSLAVILLRPGSQAALLNWRESMFKMRAQAIASIRMEGVLCESWFSFELEGHTFLYAAILRHIDQPARKPIHLEDSEIGKAHRKFKQSWDRRQKIEYRLLPRKRP